MRTKQGQTKLSTESRATSPDLVDSTGLSLELGPDLLDSTGLSLELGPTTVIQGRLY